MSRKSKLNPESLKRIVSAIELGATYQIAAEAGGVSRATLHNWLKRGKNGTTKTYKDFYEKFTQAESRGALTLLGEVRSHSVKDWKAAAWMLERRHGYRRDTPIDSLPKEETATPKTTQLDYKNLLIEQQKEIRQAIKKSEASQSWQAYTALQRQALIIAQQIRQVEAEEGALDKIDALSDEQLLTEITNAIISLPPVLRQRVAEDVSELATSNIVALKRSK